MARHYCVQCKAKRAHHYMLKIRVLFLHKTCWVCLDCFVRRSYFQVSAAADGSIKRTAELRIIQQDPCND